MRTANSLWIYGGIASRLSKLGYLQSASCLFKPRLRLAAVFYSAWFHLCWSQTYYVSVVRMLELVLSLLLWRCQIPCLCFI